eukprot:2319340-Rhodomonas_salina.2
MPPLSTQGRRESCGSPRFGPSPFPGPNSGRSTPVGDSVCRGKSCEGTVLVDAACDPIPLPIYDELDSTAPYSLHTASSHPSSSGLPDTSVAETQTEHVVPEQPPQQPPQQPQPQPQQ